MPLILIEIVIESPGRGPDRRAAAARKVARFRFDWRACRRIDGRPGGPKPVPFTRATGSVHPRDDSPRARFTGTGTGMTA